MDDKFGLPPYTPGVSVAGASAPSILRPRSLRRSRTLRALGLACFIFVVYAQWRQLPPRSSSSTHLDITIHGLSAKRLRGDLNTCAKLQRKPVDPIGLGRTKNARHIDGRPATLIKNATVWTGEPAAGTSPEDARRGKGWSWLSGVDVLLDRGMIALVGKDLGQSSVPAGTLVYDARGRPLTSGIIDMHSHAGVDSLPQLDGNEDTNELSSDITPYVRSIDGIQPGDHQIQVIKSGGVTTSLVLPGSGNNMGGEAFVIKHAVGRADGRNETSATDMLADPARTWRYMKMACGENAKRVYGKVGEHGPTSRLGESWRFRHAFEQAARIVRDQDDWCASAVAHGTEGMTDYLPVDLRWESLAALLRGHVHLNTHCYTVPDLEAFVDHSNEFKFKIRAFHHAHQTYLVPEILKRAWGDDPPASALFADNMWYKAESYIGSEYAGKYLYDHGLVPIYVSDNPVLNAQHVVFEAAKAYRYGLPYHAALASVTTAPAERLGLGQRLGKVKAGFDADVVVWDSDPLSVGATPVQVWIDGTAQFREPVELDKPNPSLIQPDMDLATIVEEAKGAEEIVFTGVSESFITRHSNKSTSTDRHNTLNVAVSNGRIVCVGACASQLSAASLRPGSIVALKNGYLAPSFTVFGSGLGLNAIDAERNTDNGDNLAIFSRGLDGLSLDTKKVRVAHDYGVTRAITAPKFRGGATHHGTSAGFLTGARSTLIEGTIFATDAALHYTFTATVKSGEKTPSISAAVGALRRKLLEAVGDTENKGFKDPFSESAFLRKVVRGHMPVAITVHSADWIAALLRVKKDVEHAIQSSKTMEKPKDNMIRMVIIGAAEAHLVASELAAANIGVVLAPMQSYRMEWDQRRALTGAPLTNGTGIDVLIRAGVLVAIGIEEDWLVRDMALLAGIAHKNSGGKITERGALAMIGDNIFTMLGLTMDAASTEEHFVIYEGSPFAIGSRIKAVGGGHGSLSVFT